MTEELKNYESTIKKKHSFGWTPKYEEEFRTRLNQGVFVPIVLKTFEKLGWDLVHKDENSAEAKRTGSWDQWTEKITVTYDYGKVVVKSISLTNEYWDNGKNSKRVKLFKYAFQQTEKEYDKKALEELEKEAEKSDKWDDYQIPEQLPQPIKRKTPDIKLPIVIGILMALMLGLLVAFLSVRGVYIIGLFEVGVAFVLGFVLKYLIQFSNYTNFKKLDYLLMGMVATVYISNQYFQYLIILFENDYSALGFLEFMQQRLKAGLTLKSSNAGWIGLLISWAIQLGFTYFIAMLRLAFGLTSYQMNRIPVEVVDFAVYHILKEKTEDQVREELAKMGWKDKQAQDEVFESIGAVQDVQDYHRSE